MFVVGAAASAHGHYRGVADARGWVVAQVANVEVQWDRFAECHARGGKSEFVKPVSEKHDRPTTNWQFLTCNDGLIGPLTEKPSVGNGS